MTDKTIKFEKLKGQSNYTIWSLRLRATLTEKGLINAIVSPFDQALSARALANIQLAVEDGPLLQIQGATTAIAAWETLKNLFSPKGFSSEFLILKEFFDTTLEKSSNSMEHFLNTIKRLSDELESKKIILPKQVIFAWVLNNLSEEYESFVTNITQSIRKIDNTAYNFDLETLFSNLLDESRRISAKENSAQTLLSVNKKRKFPFKSPKVTCSECNKKGHQAEDCWHSHPEKRPKWLIDKQNSDKNTEEVFTTLI